MEVQLDPKDLTIELKPSKELLEYYESKDPERKALIEKMDPEIIEALKAGRGIPIDPMKCRVFYNDGNDLKKLQEDLGEVFVPVDTGTQEEWIQHYISTDPFVGNLFDLNKRKLNEEFFKLCFLRMAAEKDKLREESMAAKDTHPAGDGWKS